MLLATVLASSVPRSADGAQIMKDSGVDAGMRHRRHRLAAGIKPLRPFARPAIEVPVKSVDEGHALGDVEPETVDIRDEHQQRHQRLRARRDADFGGLFHGVDGIAAGIGKRDHLGARVLGGGEIVTEIVGVEGMPRSANHPAARFFYG